MCRLACPPGASPAVPSPTKFPALFSTHHLKTPRYSYFVAQWTILLFIMAIAVAHREMTLFPPSASSVSSAVVIWLPVTSPVPQTPPSHKPALR